MREGDRRTDGRRTDTPIPARTADGLGWRERGSPRAPSSPSSSPPPHSSSTVASPKLISELVFCPSALGTRRRNGDERICSDPGELTGRGRTTGRRLNQSASLPLSPPPAPGRPLCLLGGQVLAEDDDDDDNNEGAGGAGQEGGPAAAGRKARRRGRAGLCLRDKSFLGRWWRGGSGRGVQ